MVETLGALGDGTLEAATVVSSDRGAAEGKKVFGPSPNVVPKLLVFRRKKYGRCRHQRWWRRRKKYRQGCHQRWWRRRKKYRWGRHQRWWRRRAPWGTTH